MAKEEGYAKLLQQIEIQAEIIERQWQIIEESNRTISELYLTIEESNRTISELYQITGELHGTIQELTASLGQNSRNSSKPPSSDGLHKPAPKNTRVSSGKKPGGQVGHRGSHLIATAEPDEIVLHVPAACRGCALHDNCVNNGCIGETRQVIDAIVSVKVTAHQSLLLDCPLHGKQQKGEFPDDIKATVQYGENLQALVVALNTIGAVSVNRTHEILGSVFNIPLSTGTITNMVSRCADGLTGIMEKIREKIAASGLIHCDETGTRVGGITMWVHDASNFYYTLLTLSKKRGKEGIDAGGVLPKFVGIVVHDCWASYWKYKQILHALCCAHLLRELTGVEENYPDQMWAPAFKKLLLKMKIAKEKAIEKGQDKLSRYFLKKFERQYDELLKLAYEENPPPIAEETEEKKRGRKKKGKVLSLIERLDAYKPAVCLFINNFEVPFDNNQAERDFRMVKTKTKVSGCFRSEKGGEDYLKIMSYVGTAKKHKIKPYEAIRQAVRGTPEAIFAGGF